MGDETGTKDEHRIHLWETKAEDQTSTQAERLSQASLRTEVRIPEVQALLGEEELKEKQQSQPSRRIGRLADRALSQDSIAIDVMLCKFSHGVPAKLADRSLARLLFRTTVVVLVVVVMWAWQ